MMNLNFRAINWPQIGQYSNSHGKQQNITLFGHRFDHDSI